MKDRKLHLYALSLVIAGPVITAFDVPDLLYCPFPFTFYSIDLRVDPETFKERRVAGFVYTFFCIKIVILAIVALRNLIQKKDYSHLLARVSAMIILITTARLLDAAFYLGASWDVYDFLILISDLLFAVGFTWLLRRLKLERNRKPSPTLA